MPRHVEWVEADRPHCVNATAFAAHAQSSSLPANASNAAVAAQNDSIARLNVATAILLGTAVVSALVGAGFLLGTSGAEGP